MKSILRLGSQGVLVLKRFAVDVQVAILCNHQRSIPKTHGNQMEKMQEKINGLNNELKELEEELRLAQKGKPNKDGKKLAPEA